jgi:deoxyribose-phosphate aldolase
VKRFETEAAIDEGAHEVDVVLNVGRLKDSDDKYVLRELRDVVEAADERPVKVILETCLLTREEKIRACQLTVESGARFVKTSTGFSTGGVTLEDVKLLRETVGPKFGVKASGGIRDAQTALALIAAGATRLGASSGVTIVKSLREEQAAVNCRSAAQRLPNCREVTKVSGRWGNFESKQNKIVLNLPPPDSVSILRCIF